jgi:hypothetical protein
MRGQLVVRPTGRLEPQPGVDPQRNQALKIARFSISRLKDLVHPKHPIQPWPKMFRVGR